MSPRIRLGSFDLHGMIGHGGMGEVWNATHEPTGLAVAVKVVVASPDERSQDIRREVRAAAGLDHPNVVRILDYGSVPKEAQGRFPEGRPWFAMELASGGTLQTRRGRMEWTELQATLLELLDALAHAHARGVLHRDIKPGNVVLQTERARLALVDFGLARVGGSRSTLDALSGTPGYVAPEQIEGRERDEGPWTDLYGLGALGWALATGDPPFIGPSAMAVMAAQVERDPPRFEPRCAVPPGFEGWLRSLLERDPDKRIDRAAHAAWLLHSLGDATQAPAVPRPSFDSSTREEKVEVGPITLTLETLLSAPVEDYVEGVPARPPVPGAFEVRAPRRPSARLIGAGLGLFGLRAIPLVGRELEKARLWDHVRLVERHRRPSFVVLEGAQGCGKSRLMQWLLERAHEVGTAVVLQALHEPLPSAASGLVPMFHRYLQIEGLDHASVRKRLDRVPGLAEGDRGALAEILAPVTARDVAAGARRLAVSSAGERHVALSRLVQAVAGERIVVLGVDDVQWASDTLSFLEQVKKLPLPILVVFTARDDILANRTEERERLAAFGADRLEVLPLASPEALIHQLLDLDRRTTRMLAERTGGNPLFAVQLVGDWVARGILVAGPEGLELAPGADVRLPDDLHAVWRDRIERLLVGRPDDDGTALEIAAAYGTRIPMRAWEDVLGQAGVVPSPDLLDALAALRLVVQSERGRQWSFVHGMLRESLVRRAEEAKRAALHHGAWADWFHARPEPDAREGEGLHLLRAGRELEALEPLLEAASWREQRSELNQALDLLDARDRRIAEGGLGEGASRMEAEGLSVRARVLVVQGRWEEAQPVIARALGLARTAAAASTEAHLLMSLGGLLGRQQQRLESISAIEEAAAIYQRIGDRRGYGMALGTLAVLEMERSNIQRSRTLNEEALAIHREVGNARSEAITVLNIGSLQLVVGEMDQSCASFEQALALFRALGDRRLEAAALGNLAVLHHNEERVSLAHGYGDAGLSMSREVGDRTWEAITLGVVADIATSEGRMDDALALHTEAIELARTNRDRVSEGCSHLGMAETLAKLGDREGSDRSFSAGEALLLEANATIDLGRFYCTRGQVLLNAGDVEGARAALEDAEAYAATEGAREDVGFMRSLEKLRTRLSSSTPEA